MVGEINLVANLLERWRLHWRKSLRIFEVDLASEKFSDIETLARSHPMRRILGRFVTAPSSECLWLCQEMFDYP